MNLSSFSSFFEIFCGINLAYAGSDTFIFSVKNVISNSDSLVNKIKTQIKITEASMTVSAVQNPNLKIRLKVLSNEFDRLADILIERKKHNSLFVNSHKSLFLVSGLYCLFLLILMGYEQFHLAKYNPIPRCMMWVSFIGVINIILLIRSYFARWLFKPAHFGVIFILFCIWVGISMHFCYEDTWEMSKYCISDCQEYLSVFSIIIACSGFLLFFFRSFVHEILYRGRFYILTKHYNYEVKELMYLDQFNASAIGQLKRKPLIPSKLCQAVLFTHKLYVYKPLDSKIISEAQALEQEKNK